jgi:hypothetical protein
MPTTNLWNQSVPRVELDQRSREARLRFERIDRLFILRDIVTDSPLRRLLYVSRSADTARCRKRAELKNCPVIGGLPVYRCFSGSGLKLLDYATRPAFSISSE